MKFTLTYSCRFGHLLTSFLTAVNHRGTETQRKHFLHFGHPLRGFRDPLNIMFCVFSFSTFNFPFSIVHPNFGHPARSFWTPCLHNLFGSTGKSGRSGIRFPTFHLATFLAFHSRKAGFPHFGQSGHHCAERFRCSALALREEFRSPVRTEGAKTCPFWTPDSDTLVSR